MERQLLVARLLGLECINPIQIRGNIITATIHTTLEGTQLKSLQNDFRGYEISVSTENNKAVLIIKRKSMSIYSADDVPDAFAYLFNHLNFPAIPSGKK